MVYIINPQWYSDKFYIKSRRYELYNFGYYLKEFHDVVLIINLERLAHILFFNLSDKVSLNFDLTAFDGKKYHQSPIASPY
ncbi:MAG TPA: hypothetical protein VFG46_00155 [Chryseolinea sp.]|nr:hypothetical protein [Chryseolinea sp.]